MYNPWLVELDGLVGYSVILHTMMSSNLSNLNFIFVQTQPTFCVQEIVFLRCERRYVYLKFPKLKNVR